MEGELIDVVVLVKGPGAAAPLNWAECLWKALPVRVGGFGFYTFAILQKPKVVED